MKFTAVTGGFFLTALIFSLMIFAPVRGLAQAVYEPMSHKAAMTRAPGPCGCACACPPARPAFHKVRFVKPICHPVFHRVLRPVYYYYSYPVSYPVGGGFEQSWHGEWRVVPNDAALGRRSYYDPRAGYYDNGRVDPSGWAGGVGYAPEGGGGGGFQDGYGQMHYANGGGEQNGPTYNSYNQSFQQNPSQPGPFAPQGMH